MKRILAIILSFVMVVSLSATVFAANDLEKAIDIHNQDIVLTDSDISGIKQIR